MSRVPDPREYSHDRLEGESFANALSSYDTRRRIETLIGEFLTDDLVIGKRALDVGCGLGFFAEALSLRGAQVTACDLGPNLVARTKQRVGCDAEVVDAMRLSEHFGAGAFDLVVSSECIEHVSDPQVAVREMARVLKPGGYLSLSTPNLLWYPAVRAATLLRMRPFDGLENFSTWRGLRRCLRANDMQIQREVGLHLFPFQFPLHRLSRWCDRRLQLARHLMINMCFLARRTESESR